MKTHQNADSHQRIGFYLVAAANLAETLLQEDQSIRRGLIEQARPRIRESSVHATTDRFISSILIRDLGKAATDAFKAALPERLSFRGTIAINSQPARKLPTENLAEEFSVTEGGNLFLPGYSGRCPFPVAIAYLGKFGNASQAERQVISATRSLVENLNQFAHLSLYIGNHAHMSLNEKEGRRSRQAIADFKGVAARWRNLELFDAEQVEQIRNSVISAVDVRSEPETSRSQRNNRQPLHLNEETREPQQSKRAPVIDFYSRRRIDKALE
jgi:hypothetical protein